MTSCAYNLQYLSYVAESAWGEASTTQTGAQALPMIATIDVSGMGRAFVESGRVVQYSGEVPKRILGTFTGEFTVNVQLAGHGSVTSGAMSATALESFVAWVIGAAATPPAGTTITGSASTPSALDVTSSTGYLVGQLLRVGAKSDGRAEGQWSVVSSVAVGDLGLVYELPAAPAAADVVHSATTVYVATSDCSVSSRRFFVKTADFCWALHGCFPRSWSLQGLGVGEIPTLSVTIGVTGMTPISASLPDTTATAAWTYLPAPVTAGSILLQTYGDAARDELLCRSLTIEATVQIATQMGYTAAVTGSTIVGAKRLPPAFRVNAVVEASGAPTASPAWYTAAAANGDLQLLAGLSVGAGSAMAIAMPLLRWDGKLPTQQDHEGLNAVGLTLVGSTDPAGATDLARSPLRLGFA